MCSSENTRMHEIGVAEWCVLLGSSMINFLPQDSDVSRENGEGGVVPLQGRKYKP